MHFDLDELAGMREVGQRLRDLPTEIACPLPWSEFKRRELNHRARVQRSLNRPRGALVASLAVIAVSAGVIWSQLSSPQQLSARRAVMPMSPLQVKPAPVASETGSSAASERWLAALPAEPVIVRVDTRAAVTNLEDRIAWIDDALTSVRAAGGEDRARALQNERDRLIGCLVQVRYAETLVADLP